MRTFRLFAAVGCVLGALAIPRAQTATQPLTLVRSIALPSVEGRIDHLAFDAASTNLFVAALGNNTVEVVDVAAGVHATSLPSFREPQGIASVPDLRLVAVANGQGEGLQLIDADRFAPGRMVKLGDDADNVRYDVAAKTLYAGYGGGALAAVNPADGSILGTVPLAGHPESFQLEATGRRIFVNVPDARHIAVVDRKTRKVVATWPVTTAGANYPMALDESGHRLFVGCRRPARLLVFDTQSGKEVASADIVGDTDDLFFDAARQRVYVIGGEGFIDVLDARAAPARMARMAGAPGARTGLFVPAAGRLYLAVPHRGAQRAEVRVFQAEPAAPQSANTSSTRPPTVLFMCPHGAAKSVLASAYFQKLAQERGLNVRVITAGTDPGTEVSPAVAEHLKRNGYTLPVTTPQKVSAADVESADVVISLGCDLTGLPAPRGSLRKWDEVPGPGEDFARADEAIRKRVVALIDEMTRKSSAR
jgi:protein-tyrosine-phosphatase/DNA-binding beta-propeller fold protein YncE